MRSLVAASAALVVGATVFALAPVQSEPGKGAEVPTLAEFNALEARVSKLEAATPAPSPTPEPTPSPTPEPTPSETPTPTPSPTPTPTPTPTPSPSPTPAPSAAFPQANNTGVPAGTTLTAYTGPLTITTAGTTIDAKTVNGPLTIRATGVTITRSNLIGNVTVESGSVTISDSRIDGRQFDGSAIGQRNYTLRRVNVVGARQSAACITSCDVQDSWLHAQYILPGSQWHGDGFTSNGGSNMRLVHNTLACDSKPTGAGGACSAALAIYGDFDAIRNVTVDRNLFVESPAGYCAYGGYDPKKPYGAQTSGVVITNNTFARGANGKCAAFGAITAVAPSTNGNVFSGNRWDDGATVN